MSGAASFHPIDSRCKRAILHKFDYQIQPQSVVCLPLLFRLSSDLLLSTPD